MARNGSGLKKPRSKKQADIMNHRRQLWWLSKGVVMLPTLRDEIAMHRSILAKRKAQVANG